MSNTAKTVALFGLPITNVTMAEAVARVEECIRSGHTHQIATANLDFARNALKSEYLQRIICDCSMVLPDGAPMLWASSLLKAPLKQRVTGVDLIPELARLSAQKGYRLFFLGSSEESSAAAAEVLAQRFPGVQIVGRFSPPLASLHEMDNEDILRRIAAAQPDILLVAFGNPKQEIWIHRHRDRLNACVAIGIGGAFNMIAGSLKRAPAWVQALQCEWIYRMAQEPRRLLPRYFHDATALFKHLPLGLAVNRLQPGERRHGSLRVEVQGVVRLVKTPARLSGHASAWLVLEAREAIAAGQSLVFDLAETVRVEADGLGGLLEARRIVLAGGRYVWLAAMSNPVRRVLQFSAMADLFRIAATTAEAIRYSDALSDGNHREEEMFSARSARMARRRVGIAKAS